MNLRRLVPTALGAVAVAAALSVPGLAGAVEPPADTTQNAPFGAFSPVTIKSRTFGEGVSKTLKVKVGCNYDVCEFWTGPRDGTARWEDGDFNPFAVRTLTLTRGQIRALPIRVDTFRDARPERDEQFFVAVVQDVQNAGGPWLHQESRGVITIHDDAFGTLIERADDDGICIVCATGIAP